jgi:cell division FtsZ-interacting protein ZapD
VTQADAHRARAEELLARLDERRRELERLAGAEQVDGEAAVDVIGELAEIAKEIESELNRARALADADA